MTDWLSFRKNIYSQGGEDGIIRELLRRLGITRGYVCEFGACDGKYASNTFALIERGFRGIYIEPTDEWYPQLLETCKQYPNIMPLKMYVRAEGVDTLDGILSRTPMPIDFDVLSLDIDSNDYQVWDAVKKFRPKIVIVEVNSYISPNVTDHISDATHVGTCFHSMRALGESKGYNLICHTGNLIFVRSDLGITGDRNQFIMSWFNKANGSQTG